MAENTEDTVPDDPRNFDTPVDDQEQQPGADEVNHILSSYEIAIEGSPENWNLVCTKVSPRFWNNVESLMPVAEELPLIPRSALEKVLNDNWGGGYYTVDVYCNGVRKRSIQIDIPPESSDPIPRAYKKTPEEGGSGDAADQAIKLLAHVQGNRENEDLRRMIGDLAAQIGDLKNAPQSGSDTLTAVLKTTSDQAIKAMELKQADNLATAERVEAAAARQQETLMTSMTTMMESVKSVSQQQATFQGDMYKILQEGHTRESELLRSVIQDGKENKDRATDQILNMIGVGLNLGTAMGGSTSPEEKMIEAGSRALEKYLEIKSRPGPAPSADELKGIAHRVLDDARKKAVPALQPPVAAAVNPAPAPAAEPAKPSDTARAAQIKAVADEILRVVIAFGKGEKSADDVADAILKHYDQQEMREHIAENMQDLIIMLRTYGSEDLVNAAIVSLDEEKMAAIEDAYSLKVEGGVVDAGEVPEGQTHAAVEPEGVESDAEPKIGNGDDVSITTLAQEVPEEGATEPADLVAAEPADG